MQTKPLRSLGLDVTAQTLDNLLKTNEAFKDLGVTSSKALLQSDKAMLRLIVVLQNAQNSFGDINRTINTLSNQLRVFESSLSNLRLAIGDLFAEPFRNALIYINAFLIAITKIIRAFKPIATESETAGAGMQQFADDVENATDAATGGGNLDFDEFRVLSSGENEQVSITQTITEELQKQIEAYNEQISAMNEVQNKAVEIAEKIKDWFIVTDKGGAFVEWTDNAKLLFAALGTLIALPIVNTINNWITSFIKFTSELKKAEVGTKALTIASNALRVSGIFLLIYSITQLITSWDEMNNVTRTLYILLSVVGAALIVFSNQTLLKTFVGALQSTQTKLLLVKGRLQEVQVATTQAKLAAAGLGVAFGSLLGSALTALPDDIQMVVGAISLLIGVALAAAIALGAFHSAWSIGLAAAGIVAGIIAITDAIGNAESAAESAQNSFNASGFAEGGITDANFIMTHENGVREWVGRQGNSTAVVNDTQMSDVMGRAVRNGVLEALSYNTGNGETFNITVQANLDGQKVYESTKRIARRNGEKFARV